MHWLTGWGITLYRSWRVQKRIYGGDGVRIHLRLHRPRAASARRYGRVSLRPLKRTVQKPHPPHHKPGSNPLQRPHRYLKQRRRRRQARNQALLRPSQPQHRHRGRVLSPRVQRRPARARPTRSRSTGPPRHRLFHHQCRVLRPLLRLFGPRAPTAKLRAAPRRLRRQEQRLRKARANRIRLFPNGR